MQYRGRRGCELYSYDFRREKQWACRAVIAQSNAMHKIMEEVYQTSSFLITDIRGSITWGYRCVMVSLWILASKGLPQEVGSAWQES